MATSALPPALAKLKLTILNKKAEAKKSLEVYFDMKNLGLPDVIIDILEKIWKVTSKAPGQVISIGKIIVIELLNFALEHPLQVTGLAVGLSSAIALGVAVHGLFALIPSLAKMKLIGGLLAKLALATANLCKSVTLPFIIGTPVATTVVGEILDQKFPVISQSLQQIARDYFELFSKIINALKDTLKFNETAPAFA